MINKWLLRLADRFEKRNHLLVVADLFFEQQNVTVIQFDAKRRLDW